MMQFARSVFFATGLLWAFAAAAHAFTIQEVKSPGGITAWLVEEKAVPLMAMNFSFRSGSAHDPEGKEGAAEFLTGMMDEGAGEMLSQEFQRKREELAFRMSFSADADFFEGSFQTLTRNRKASVDLLKLAITSPRFDAEPLERVRQQFLLNVKEKQQDPQSIAWRAWMQQGHARRPLCAPGDGTEATMAAMTADDLRAAHRRIFNRDTLQVAVVGDISAAELGPLLDEVFGGLPAIRSAERSCRRPRSRRARSSRSSRGTFRRASSSSATRASCAAIRISSPPCHVGDPGRRRLQLPPHG